MITTKRGVMITNKTTPHKTSKTSKTKDKPKKVLPKKTKK